MFVTINNDNDGNPFEVFATIGKSGGEFAANSEAICRMVSVCLRSGIRVDKVIEQLTGIRGPMPAWYQGNLVLSIPDAIAQVLVEHTNKYQQKLDLGWQEKKVKPVKQPTAMAVAVGKVEAGEGTGTANLKTSQSSLASIGLVPECPECGNRIEFSEGCLICRSCGYSKCG